MDVHLVIDPFPRQFNTWRNAARLWARTRWVMMLDVDFAVCTDFRAAIRGIGGVGGEGRRVLDEGGGLVIPAFEYTRASEGVNASTFPTDKPVRTLFLFCIYVQADVLRRLSSTLCASIASARSTHLGLRDIMQRSIRSSTLHRRARCTPCR